MRNISRENVIRKFYPGAIVFFVIFYVHFLSYQLGFSMLIPSGDEPHYLMTTHSLLTDGDIELTNNFAQKNYQLFGVSDLSPQRYTIIPGKIYPGNPWGFSLILVPAYFLGGYRGIILFLILVMALTGLTMFLLSRKLGAGPVPSGVAAVLLACFPPLFFYGSLVYPETVMALLLSWAAYILVGSKDLTWKKVIQISLVLVPMAVVHQRGISYIIAISLVVLVVFRKGWFKSAVMAAIALTGWITMVVITRQMTGITEPYIFMRSEFTEGINWVRNFSGLLYDRESGILSLIPLIIVILPGLTLQDTWQMKRLRWVIGFAILGPGLAALNPQWWGGWSPPGRYFVGLIPLFSAPAAVFLGSIRKSKIKLIYLVLMIPSILISVRGVMDPIKLYHDGNGIQTIIWNTPVLKQIYFLLPSVRAGDIHAWSRIIGLTGIIAGLWFFSSCRVKRIGLTRYAGITVMLIGVGFMAVGIPQTIENYRYWEMRLCVPLSLADPWLIKPEDNAALTRQSPTFSWTDVPGSEGYHIYFKFPDGFVRNTQTAGGRPEFTPTAGPWKLLPPGEYDWFVVPYRGMNRGQPSDTRRFTLR